MDILFIASTAVITQDPTKAQALYVETLGLPLKAAENDADYVYAETIEGSKHFGAWPLTQAAEACFGTREWPNDVPTPQASVEFEVGSPELVAEAEQELIAKGHVMLHPTKTEVWGQTVVRFQDADGALIGISYAPWMH